MVIAIDGPAGAGKSTVSRELARELGYAHLDSGAMYRCVALLSLRRPGEEPASLARGAQIELLQGAPGEPARVLLDGRDESEAIRAPEVAPAASRVAADAGVRAALVERQRALLASGDWVAEGRDIGTVVAPEAALKVYLTADPAVRAQRRAAQEHADAGAVLAAQAARDARDTGRANSPLRAAPDAVTLDTSDLAVSDVVALIAGLARGLARTG
jgi:cytidylate kinase